MSERRPPATTDNLLRRVGANMRLYLERCHVDPERTSVIIIVPDETAVSHVISAFLRDFDASTMDRRDDKPSAVAVFKLNLHVGVMESA